MSSKPVKTADKYHLLKGKTLVTGSAANDTFVYKTGDGSVSIRDVNDSKSSDTLSLSDLSLDDVMLVREGNALRIVVRDTGDVITVSHQFSGWHGVETLTFAGGQTFDSKGIKALTEANSGLRIYDRFGAIFGDGKANVLEAMDKFGFLAGGAGSDTYKVETGHGNVFIRELGGAAKDKDTLDLSKFDSDDVKLTRAGNHLVVTFVETGERITVENQFLASDASYGVEKLALGNITLDETGIANVVLNGWSTNGLLKADASGNLLGNGSFEDFVVASNRGAWATYWGSGPYSVAVSETHMGGWDTNDARGLVEIWQNGFGGRSGFDGGQFLELNAFSNASLSQVVAVEAGSDLELSFAHSGRAGIDTMRVTIMDAVTGAVIYDGVYATGTAWHEYAQSFTIGDATTSIKITFTAIDTHGDNVSVGNLLDAIELVYVAQEELPAVMGTENVDDLHGTAASERVYGLNGDDFVYGEGGNDIIDAGGGLDTIWGGAGNDTFVYAGNSGRDYIIDFAPGQDKVMIGSSLIADGKSVMDYAYQDGKSVIFEFGDKVLVLWGQNIANITEALFEVFNDQGGVEGETFTGTANADTIMGTFGDDTIFGGAGFDEIRGSHGADTFVFKPGSDRDFIVDFNAAHDTLEISSSLIGAGKTIWDYAYEDGGTTVFEFNDTDVLVLWHVPLANLSDAVIELV